MLATKIRVGSNRWKRKVSKVASAQEECILVGSDMTKEGRKIYLSKKFWKKGWVEEVENKTSIREVETLSDKHKVEMKTKNKIMMDFSP